jgi:hypothetical protein
MLIIVGFFLLFDGLRHCSGEGRVVKGARQAIHDLWHTDHAFGPCRSIS